MNNYDLIWAACQMVALRRSGEWKTRTAALSEVLGCAVNTAHRLPYSLASGRESMTPRRVSLIAGRAGLTPEFVRDPTLEGFASEMKKIFKDNGD